MQRLPKWMLLFALVWMLAAVIACQLPGTWAWSSNQQASNESLNSERETLTALTVKKQVRSIDGSELPEERLNERFSFTVVIDRAGVYSYTVVDEDGVMVKFGTTGGRLNVTLSHGDTLRISRIPIEVSYRITEQTPERYQLFASNASGTLDVDGATAIFTNVYEGDPPLPPPTSVTPTSADLPLIRKRVEGENAPTASFSFVLEGLDGAPMPEGSSQNKQTVRLSANSSAETELGRIAYEEPGVYAYRIYEVTGSADGWQYDETEYRLTVTVKQNDDFTLEAEAILTKNGEVCTEYAAEFVNTYDDPIVRIGGRKVWYHGNNPQANWPDEVIVEIFGDGERILQKSLDAASDWQYEVELPKYAADGHRIVYTVSEQAIDGYALRVDGFDLYNTYVEQTDVPQTGDRDDPRVWMLLMLISLAAMILLTVYIRHNRPGAHREKKAFRRGLFGSRNEP